MNGRLMLLVAAIGSLDGAPRHPTLFGSGTISTPAPEFAITFSAEGDEVFFNRATPDRRSMVILTTRLVDGRWTEPSVAPFSGTYLDVDPFLAPNGRRLYFSSNRPRGQGKAGDFNTWYVERTGQGWGPPIDPGPSLNSDSSDVFVSEARDGTVVFSSNRDGASRVYLARRVSGGWTVPEPVSFGTLRGGGNPLIDPDGRFILLVAPGPDDRADLHISCRAGAGWGEPIRLPEINSRWADFAPAFRAPRTVYFTSERPGLVPAMADSSRPPGDIYSAELPALCPATLR